MSVENSNEDAVTEAVESAEDTQANEAAGLVHVKMEEAKAAWTNKLGVLPCAVSSLLLLIYLCSEYAKEMDAKAYVHFMSEVVVVWNDKQDRWEQQFTCDRYVSPFIISSDLTILQWQVQSDSQSTVP